MQGNLPQMVPQSARIVRRGINTTSDLSEYYVALLGDIVTGAVLTEDAVAACKTGDKIIRLMELEHQHGGGEALPLFGRRVLPASSGPTVVPKPSDEQASAQATGTD